MVRTVASRTVASRALPRRMAMIQAVALGSLAQGAQVALLATSAWLITRAAEQPPILYLTLAIVAVRAFALSRAVFRYLERLHAHHHAFVALEELRVWLYRRLVPLAPAGLWRRGRGDVLTTLGADVDTLQDYPLRVVQPVASALSVVVLSVGALAVVDYRASALLAAILILAGALSIWWQRVVSATADRDVAPARAELADWLMDTIQRRAVLAAFDADRHYYQRARELDDNLRRVERRAAWGQSLIGGAFTVFAGLAVVGVVLVVSPRVAEGGLSGPLFALLVLTPLALFEVFQAVPQAVSAWRRVSSSAERIAQLVPDDHPAGIPVDIEDDAQNEPILPVESLRWDNFSAAWPTQSSSPFVPVTLNAKAGERVLIEGPSGVGKSTLASAMVGFIDYTGHCQIDGVELKSMSMATRRRHIVLIEQRPHLFDTSIRHNLSFASVDADDQELWNVLGRVGLVEWAHSRGGLDSPVGESGALVSGGQAQRIALARAFLAKAPIIVLDEPTANVDRAMADALMDDLLTSVGQGPQRIAIVISHVPVRDELINRRCLLLDSTAQPD